jgi:carbamoyltransferase
MIVLGLAGGFDFAAENDFDLPFDGYHDSAAVLVRDGEVVAGMEEERLNRIKHTNKAPSRAARCCLEHAGIAFPTTTGAAPRSRSIVIGSM